MIVSKTISLELEDLAKIEEKIKKGEESSVSEFVQKSIKKQLKSD